MPKKAANTSLLFIACIILTACGVSQTERDALGTAIAAGIYATQTAASLPTSTPPPATPTSAALQLAGDWEGTADWPGLTFRIRFSVAKGSNEVGDLNLTVTCPESAAPDGEFSFPPSKIEDGAFSAFGTVGRFVASDRAEGTFDAGARVACAQGEVPLSGAWVATKNVTQSPAATPVPPTATPPSVTATPAPTATPPPTATPTPPIIGEMLRIPAGTFQRGCDPDHAYADVCRDNLPLYTVDLDTFRIDRTEVTNAQYAHCVAAGGCTPPSGYSSVTRAPYYDNPLSADYPVIQVNWHQASAYCAWAGKRLPTAAEWEKAARGASDTRPFPWGDAEPSCLLANFRDCVGDTSAVGSYPAGASPYGVLDLIGNVGEWVNDWYRADYDRRWFIHNPLGAAVGTAKVTMGGGWATYSGELLDGESARASSLFATDKDIPFFSYSNIGFRCAASVSDETDQPTPAGAGAAPVETPPAALPSIEADPPQPDKASAAGRVMWNNQPVIGTAVNLCTEYALFGGCGGKRYATKTDRQGAFVFENVPPVSYYLLVHAIDVDGWFFQRPTDAWSFGSPITYSFTAGETYRFQDVQVWKHDLAGALAKPGPEGATLSWKAYPGAAYYAVYIGPKELDEPIGERINSNSVRIASPPLDQWWRVEAFNDQGLKIAQTRDYLDFRALRAAAASGSGAKPAATRPRPAPTAPAAPVPAPSGAGGLQTGQQVPFQVIACPTQGVAISSIIAAKPGWWDIRGDADIQNLEYWKCEISADGTSWTVLKRSESPLRDGVLVEFNTGSVPRGAYQIRLTAVDRTGNYPEPCVIQVSTG
jgi:formylglycine-generating enzyme required for sulfatase activity